MLNNYLSRPRKKAFLGSIISGVIGIGSSIFGAAKQKEAQRQQYRLQRNMELRNTGLTSAANLTRTFANADELDEEFRNRFYRYGGRKKAEAGTESSSGESSGGGWKWSLSDTNALISGLSSAGSNIATAMIGQAQQRANYINAINPLISDKKDNEAIYDSAARTDFLNNYYRTANLRAGGKRKLKY